MIAYVIQHVDGSMRFLHRIRHEPDEYGRPKPGSNVRDFPMFFAESKDCGPIIEAGAQVPDDWEVVRVEISGFLTPEE